MSPSALLPGTMVRLQPTTRRLTGLANTQLEMIELWTPGVGTVSVSWSAVGIVIGEHRINMIREPLVEVLFPEGPAVWWAECFEAMEDT